jgi:hypothetical protein
MDRPVGDHNTAFGGINRDRKQSQTLDLYQGG